MNFNKKISSKVRNFLGCSKISAVCDLNLIPCFLVREVSFGCEHFEFLSSDLGLRQMH